MAWIAKRPVTLVRDGVKVKLPPGSEVPEAAGMKRPDLWCVWSEPAVVETEKGSEPSKESNTEVDYETMTNAELKELVKPILEAKGDTTSVNKFKKDELIAILTEKSE